MKNKTIKNDSKNLSLLSILLLFLSLSLLTAFSFDASGKEELLNNAVFRYSDSSSANDFSYSIKIKTFDEELAARANRYNRSFYNDRNVVSIMENTDYGLFGKDIVFSNCSKLDTAEGFTTNHLLFSSVGSTKVIDLDFFESVGDGASDDSSVSQIGIIIPYSLSLKMAHDKSCSFEQLLYSDASQYFEREGYRFFISGIWDDQIVSTSYYFYNAFYAEFAESVIFVNNEYVFSPNNSSAYFLMGNNRARNLDFLHSCKNSNGGSLDFCIPQLKINDFHVNGLLLCDYYQHLIGYYQSFQIAIISVFSGVIFIFLAGIFLFILIKHRDSFRRNIFFLKIKSLLPIFSAVFASLIVACISHIKIDTIPVIAISSRGMLLVCIMNLFLSVAFFFAFRNNGGSQPQKESQITLPQKVAIVSFCDLRATNASTIRIKSIIKMIEKAGKQWLHIGYFDRSGSTDKNIGIKRFENKYLDFLFAPFFFVRALKRIKNQIRVIYIYSPLPIFSSIVVNCFASINHLEVVHDVCEFQNISEVNFRKPGWFYLSNVFYNKFLIGLNDKVIPITTYLDRYFKSKGAKTLLIPPVFDENVAKPIIKEGGKDIVFTYIGFPGKKDNLKMLIDGFCTFFQTHKDLAENIQVHLYGPLEKYAKYVTESCERDAKERFHFYGKCSREELPRIYAETSFIFFIRDPRKRFSKAGFPSKAVESLFYSTPLFTNKTSDLALYLHEPNHVIWIDEYSSVSVCRSLERIVVDYNHHVGGEDCRKLAIRQFSLNKYAKAFADFLFSKGAIDSEIVGLDSYSF